MIDGSRLTYQSINLHVKDTSNVLGSHINQTTVDRDIYLLILACEGIKFYAIKGGLSSVYVKTNI